jgi:hypothetical protein
MEDNEAQGREGISAFQELLCKWRWGRKEQKRSKVMWSLLHRKFAKVEA